MFIRIALAIAVVYTGWIFLSRYLDRHPRGSSGPDQAQTQRNKEFLNVYGGSQVKILQFYAREGNLTQGSPTVLCYGVLNAKSVRIEPAVEDVTPSLSKCVEVSPLKETRYTLTAQGEGGATATESLVLAVNPDAATLPRITYFRVANQRVEGSRHLYMLSFGDQNAEEVSIDPPVFPTLHGAPNGQFLVSPEKTTTYTLTVTGKFGHKAERTLTVEVK